MLYFPTLVCWNGKFGSKLCGLFDKTHNRPCIGSCGHSVCMPCIDANPALKCPICHVENAFLERKVNYSALDWIEMFSTSCVDVYGKWWQETQKTIGSGYCIHCSSDSGSLRICVTCELSAPFPIIQCYDDIITLKIDNVSVAKLPLSLKCANCIADGEHDGHRCVKLQDVKESEIRIKVCSYEVASRFLRAGLENGEGRNCKMRRDRMMNTCQKLTQKIWLFCGEATRIVLFKSERTDLTEKSQEIEIYLKSLKAQWKEYMASTETCQCTMLFENTPNKDNIASIFHSIPYKDLDLVFSGCPLDQDKNRALRNCIPLFLKLDNENAMKAMKKEAVKPPIDLKTLIAPVDTIEDSTSTVGSSVPEEPTVSAKDYKLLYNHVKELTQVVKSLVDLVPKEKLDQIPRIPELPGFGTSSSSSSTKKPPI